MNEYIRKRVNGLKEIAKMKKVLVVCITGLLVFALTGVSFAFDEVQDFKKGSEKSKKREALVQAIEDAMAEAGVMFMCDCGYGGNMIASLLQGVNTEDVEGLRMVVEDGPVISSYQGLSEKGWKELVHRLIKKYGDSILGEDGKVDIILFRNALAPIVFPTVINIEMPVGEMLQRKDIESVVESQASNPLFSPEMADEQQEIIPLQEK